MDGGSRDHKNSIKIDRYSVTLAVTWVAEQVVIGVVPGGLEMVALARRPPALLGEAVHYASVTILMPEETLRLCDKRLMG